MPLDYRSTAARVREFVAETANAARAADKPALRAAADAAEKFAAAAEQAGRRVDAMLAAGPPAAPAAAAADSMLMRAERAFLDPAGIPDRPWYRHLLYAPKPTYAAEVLPGVTEAIEAGDRKRLDEQVARLAAALTRAAAILR